MNYKQVEENAKKYNDNFWNDFLRTLKMCKTYSSMLKTVQGGSREYLSETRIKSLIKAHAETLKCFVGCIR